MNGKPKPAFYIVAGVVVVVLVAFSIYRFWDWLAPKPTPTSKPPDIVLNGSGKPKTPEVPGGGEPVKLTFEKYEIVPEKSLPPVTGTSKYTPLSETNNTVRFAINVWAG